MLFSLYSHKHTHTHTHTRTHTHAYTGIPQAPMAFTVIETGQEGGVSIMLVTNSAGVGASPHSFQFDVSYTSPGRDPLVADFPIETYQSGESATVTIEGLDVGHEYNFSARARNQFGSSDYTQGPTIRITGVLQITTLPPTMTTSPCLGTLSAGAAVSIAAVICSLVFFIGGTLFGGLVVYIYLKRHIRTTEVSHSTSNSNPVNALYEDVGPLELGPPSLPQASKDIELNENAAYGKVQM